MIGLMFTTFSGKIVEANDTFLRFVGYSRKEFEDGLIDWVKLTPPEHMLVTQQAIEHIKAHGYSQPYEKAYYHKNGSLVYLLMGAVLIPEAKNYDCMTYVIDVSDKKVTEQELRRSRLELEDRVTKRTQDIMETNLFLNSLIENIPNMIFVKDAKNLKFVRFNKGGEQLTGLKKENLIGKSDFDFFPKSEAQRFVDADKAVLDSKKILDIPEETLTTKNGPKILHTKKIPLLDSKGQPIYLLGISEDITVHKKIESEKLTLIREQAAREEAEKNVHRLELLAEANSILSSSLDFKKTAHDFYDFIINRVANYCQLVTKTGNEETTITLEPSPTDKSIVLKFDEFKWKFIKDVDSATSANDQQKKVLETLRSLNLKSVIVAPLRLRNDTLGHLLVATTRESDKNLNLGDLQIIENLAERASLALDNARLFSDAQKANRLKDEFLATLSHELRTPLNVIHGYSELLKNFSENMSDEEKNESIVAIYRNALDQATLINDILDVSKIITGKMSVDLSPQSPSDIILSVVKNSVRTAEIKGIQLITQMPKVPPIIMMDSTRMHQIAWNLVSNAIKFTPEGGKILVKNYAEDSQCVIAVQDSGKGIAPDFLPFIFEKFRQEDGSMTRKHGGLGLGLTIVSSLVEMHGGSIEAYSEGKDRGAEFIVRIPLLKGVSGIVTKKAQSIPLERQLAEVRILLIEDSKDNRLLVSRLLTNYGAEMKSAGSVSEARSILKQYTPDIILCDIGMPDEDGVQFIKEYRQANNRTPVIALTAYAREEEKARFLKEGFQSHIAKPVAVDLLLNEIKRLISVTESH